FFQAEDGIRDFHVTGVQTCALPISFAEFDPSADDLRAGVGLYSLVTDRVRAWGASAGATPIADDPRDAAHAVVATNRGLVATERSEERRVGKECRSRRTE